MLPGHLHKRVIMSTTTSGGPKHAFIESLPDVLLVEVISRLRLADAVRTSALSRRWKNLWKYIEKLNFVITDRSGDFHSQFVSRLRVAKLHTLRIDSACDRSFNHHEVKELAGFGRDAKVEHLFFGSMNSLPRITFSIATLKSLELSFIDELHLPDSFNLPRLNTIVLTGTRLGDSSLHTFLLNCPVLENLSVIDCFWAKQLVFRSEKSNLKNLKIVTCGYYRKRMVIALPNLECLELEGPSWLGKCSMEDLLSLRKVAIDFYFDCDVGDFDAWGNILSNLSHVDVLKLRVNGSEVHEMEACIHEQLCLKIRRLELTTSLASSRDLRTICQLLSSSPNLEILKIFDNKTGSGIDEIDCWEHLGFSFSSLLPRLREVIIYLSVSGSHYDGFSSRFESDFVLKGLEKKSQLLKILVSKSMSLERLVIVPRNFFMNFWKPELLVKLGQMLQSFSKASPLAKIVLSQSF